MGKALANKVKLRGISKSKVLIVCVIVVIVLLVLLIFGGNDLGNKSSADSNMLGTDATYSKYNNTQLSTDSILN